MNNYTNILREHNLKATPQRLAMMDIICGYGHITIDSLYEEVKKRFSSISLATIYKNINAMISNRLLLEVKVPNDKSVFEIVKEDHSHLKCNQCGSITDIDVNTSGLIGEISKKYQFAIDKSDLVLSGVCKNCNPTS